MSIKKRAGVLLIGFLNISIASGFRCNSVSADGYCRFYSNSEDGQVSPSYRFAQLWLDKARNCKLVSTNFRKKIITKASSGTNALIFGFNRNFPVDEIVNRPGAQPPDFLQQLKVAIQN